MILKENTKGENMFCDKEEAQRILLTIPNIKDIEKLSWYIGSLEGQLLIQKYKR